MARKQVQQQSSPSSSPKASSSSSSSPKASSPKAAAAAKDANAKTPVINKANKKSSSTLGLVAYAASVALVAVLSLALVPRETYVPPANAPLDVGVVARRLASTWTTVAAHVDAAIGGSPSKYKTDIVGVEPRVFVSAEACDSEFASHDAARRPYRRRHGSHARAPDRAIAGRRVLHAQWTERGRLRLVERQVRVHRTRCRGRCAMARRRRR
ncbi:hypothetical protein PINS_up013798 [Pythium insidiosum]|nr:hypothetical protein PINS_up013798 [Pythium insidiosum]